MEKMRLTHPQKRIMAVEMLSNGVHTNNLPNYIFFPKNQEATLKKVIEAVLFEVKDIHLQFALTEEGEYVAYYVPYYAKEDDIQILDLRGESEELIQETINQFVLQPFGDVFDKRLFQFKLVLTNEHTVLCIRIHHIICDGTGIANLRHYFIKMFESVSNGNDYKVPINNYLKYYEIEEAYLNSQEYLKDKSYWMTHLEDLTECSEGIKNEGDFHSKTIAIELSNETVSKLKGFTHSFNKPISPYVFTMGLMNIFVGRYYNSKTVVMTSGYNNRTYEDEINNAIGMLVSTVPLKMQYDGKCQLSKVFEAAKAELKQGLSHSQYPYDLLLEDLKKADVDINKLLNFAIVSNSIYDNGQYTLKTAMYNATYAPLLIRINWTKEDKYGLQSLHLEFRKDCFQEKEMETIASCFRAMIEDIAKNPNQTCGEVRLISEEEEAKIINVFNNTKVDYDDLSETIIDMFKNQVRRTPENIAVVYEGKAYSYQQLDELTDRLAKHLITIGVKTEDTVAVLIDRSEYMTIYPLAILKAGAGYMPLDYTFPIDRLEYMLEDAQVKVLLSEGNMPETYLPSFEGIVLKKEDCLTLKDNTDYELPVVKGENKFVILYTSGSTGMPKGCVLEHRNLSNFCKWYQASYQVTEQDKGAAYANFAFDAHMMDLYPFLISGATIHIIPSHMRLDFLEINNYFEKNGISLAFMTTLLGKQFVETFDNKSLRALTVGGEKLPAIKIPKYPLYNAYGPTEGTIISSTHKLNHENECLNIGKPLYNCHSYILDANMQLLPIGAVGELCIGGAGVGRGYLNRPDLTAEKFVMWKGEKIYRTGDFVKWLENGEIEFVGRIDGQVKLRGLRIELGEIESKMNNYEGIKDCAVAVKEIGGTQYLCAYYVRTEEDIDVEDLKTALAVELTSFMIPSSFTRLEKLPLTSNGKINKKALPDPIITQGESVKPRDEKEQAIYELIRELVANENIGVTDDLFTIGLTSLMAIKVAVLLKNKLNYNIATNEIIKGKTIENIAKASCVDQAGQVEEINEKRSYYPLTQNQLGLYFDCEKNPNTLIYNIPICIEFFKEMNIEQFKEAVIKVVNTHPYMKTQLSYQSDQLVQLRKDEEAVQVEVVYRSGKCIDEMKKAFVRPFTLLNSALYRFLMIQDEDKTTLLFDIHHMIFDGGSANLFIQDLLKAYKGEVLEGEKITAFDLAIKEEKEITSQKYEADRAYFKNKLETQATDLEQTAIKDGKKIGVAKATVELKKVKAFCRHNGITASNLFMAAFLRVLNTYTREETITIATISNGRGDISLANSFGMFVKTLPVVSKLEKEKRILEFIKEVQSNAFETIEHESFPLTQMSAQFGFKPNMIYAFQGGTIENNQTDMAYQVELLSLDTAKMPLTVNVFEEDQYRILMDYDGERYCYDYINSLVQAVKHCVEYFIENSNQTCKEVRLISVEEEAKIINVFNNTKVDYDDLSETIIDMFKNQVRRTPENIAVVYEGKAYSYQQLDELTDRLAKHLIKIGVKTEDTVAVLIDRSEYMAIYPLAILKAGAGYMPLDYTFPIDRLEYMLEDAQVKVLLSEGNMSETYLPSFEGIVLKKEECRALKDNTDHELPVIKGENKFVVLYTSGSTGMPKGCVLEHRNLANFCKWYQAYYQVTEQDKGAAYANFGFDAHMMDLYPFMMSGATIHIIPSHMRLDFLAINSYFEKNEISLAFMTTLLGKQFVETFENKSLRALTVGGEKLPSIKIPKYPLYNAYGPTECTIFTSTHKLNHENECLNIGKPLHNYHCYILDANMQLLPIGAVGELCIGGAGVGRGYLNRPDLTAEKFVMWKGEKIYRTGDYAKWLENGEIEFVGRIDGQVKLRGLRIELGEIESKMNNYEGIKDCAVAVKEIGGTQYLCAYYVSTEEDIDLEALKTALAVELTSFMIPSSFTRLEKLPLTSNGKINKKALPDPIIIQGESVKPRDEKEQAIYDLISELVGNENIGVTDDLFTVGLTSLMAIKVAVLLKNKLNYSIPTNEIIKGKTIENIAKASQIAQAGQGEEIYEKRDYYSLTQNQLGLYFDCEKNPNTLIYNIPMCIGFLKAMNLEQLKEALIKVVNAHSYMKTQLSYESDQLVQQRKDEEAVQIDVIYNLEKSIEQVKQEFLRPFTMLNTPLYRFLVIEEKDKTTLLFDIHHMIFDGGSANLFIQDLLKAYQGEALEGEKITAFDVAIKEEKESISEKYQAAQEYFKNKLETQATDLEQTQTKDNKKIGQAKATVELKKVKDFCRQNGITASNLFMAAFLRVLNTYAREETISIATISNGRGDIRLANSFGMFVKTLPVVSKLEKEKRILEFIKEVQSNAFETIEHESFPLTQMSAQFGFKPNIMYAFQGGTIENNQTELAYQVESLSLDAVKMPLSVNVFEENKYKIVMDYDGEKYCYDYINSLAQAMKSCVEYFIESPDKTIDRISFMTKGEEQEILEISKGEILDYDKTATFISLFQEQVKIRPESLAIVDEISEVTYREADQYSENLAKYLVHLGMSDNVFVGIMLPRRKEFMISVLATMKAGGAYIPIDSEYPKDRIEHMLKDSGAKVLITTKELLGDTSIDSGKIIFIEEYDFKRENKEISLGLALPRPDDLAYMIYTSGSTGKPKGVKICHESLTAFITWCKIEYQLKAGDKACCYCSLSFDASVIDLFPALTVGGELHIASEEMRFDLNCFQRYINEHEIYCCALSTQVGMEFLNQFETSLQYVMLGGEKLMPVKKTNTKLYNGYGPTEFTICSSFHVVDQDKEYHNIPIGRPVPNSWSIVVDSHLNLMPIGVAGELCLSGIQIAQGYHNRLDLTAEKFIDNPYKNCAENEKMYRTGDLVRWNKDGELEYLGRIDTQIKLRGFRIELGEIESVMAKYEGITSVAADVRMVGNVQHICGYYTQEKEVDIEELKQYLQKSLTEYMVPTAFIQLEKMPLTPNGKVNKKALPNPMITSATEYIAPRNELEEKLCHLFEELLKLDQVGINDDFFLLGGNSLLAMSLVGKCINQEIHIVYGNVFECKTPRKLCEMLKAQHGHDRVEENLDQAQYDYKEINQVLSQNRIPDMTKAYIETQPMGDILLTGATGFLGIHVLKEIIENHLNKVYCLVRAKKGISVEDRLKSLLHYYFEKDYAECFSDRIIVIEGDATKPETITVEANTVINCAANVKHFAQGDELDQINIGGVINLIDYCKKNDATLIQVSTTSIGGSTKEVNCEVIFDENMLYFNQDLENKYIYSKFMAERYVLEAVTKGLKAKIMRVGNLMSRDSDGEFQINVNGNGFMNSLRAYKLLGAFPISEVDELVEFSPIDLTAKALVKLAATSEGFTIYHPVNTHKVDMYDVMATMKDYGFKIDIVDNAQFNQVLQEKMKDEKQLKYLLGILAYQRNEEATQLYRVTIDNKFTSNILLRLGFRWPITTEEYIKKSIEAVDGLGFFDV